MRAGSGRDGSSRPTNSCTTGFSIAVHSAVRRRWLRDRESLPMLSLADLLSSADGLRFLESKGVVVDRMEFVRRLRRPASGRLCEALEVTNARPVYTAQQIYIDYRRSVMSKLLVLHDLEQE